MLCLLKIQLPMSEIRFPVLLLFSPPHGYGTYFQEKNIVLRKDFQN